MSDDLLRRSQDRMTTDELRASLVSLTGYPPESRTVQAFIAVAEAYAQAEVEVALRDAEAS